MDWYITITNEMREAGLSGNGLLVFAIVHGYSQQQDGYCYMSLASIAERAGCTPETARNTLRSLTDAGFLDRVEFMDGNVRRVAYRTTQKIWGTQNFRQDPPKNLGGTPQKIWDNNKVYNKSENKVRSNSAREAFDFRSALLSLGVTEPVADDWLEIRQKAKAVNSRTAFDEIARQIARSGIPADDCIRKAVARNWRGFEAAWLQDRRQPSGPAPRRYESPEEHNLRVLREMQQRDGMLHTFQTPDEQ